MQNIGTFELDWTTVFVIVISVAVLILQIWLCRKGKKLAVKLIPSGVLSVCAIVCGILSEYVNGWDGLGYLFFTLLSVWLIVVCGIGWGLSRCKASPSC